MSKILKTIQILMRSAN